MIANPSVFTFDTLNWLSRRAIFSFKYSRMIDSRMLTMLNMKSSACILCVPYICSHYCPVTMSAETKTDPKPAEHKIINGVFTLVPQVSLNARNQQRFSRQYVILVKSPGTINDTNWELGTESSIPVVAEYVSGILPVPDGYVAAYYSETGQAGGKILRSAPTYVATGKNLGKKNATNIVQQAISESETKWNKNARKGGYVVESATSAAELAVVQSGRIKPMALHEFPPQSSDGKFDISGTSYWKEGQEMYWSIKYDGNRLVSGIDLSRKAPDETPIVDLWGRPGDTPPNPLTHIRTQLEAFVRAQPDLNQIILDGEIWAPGMRHQVINGIFMNAAADSSQLSYRVFDIVDETVTFKVRYQRLLEMFERAKYPNIVLVDQELASKSAQFEKAYRAALAAGHEGLVLRHPDGMYEAGVRKEVRSKFVLKLKPVYDSEFEIVGYKSGEGRDSGAIIWTLKMPNGHEFSARPAETLDERRALFASMASKFETEYRGRMLRISYGDTTALGIPRFPRVIGFRDQKA